MREFLSAFGLALIFVVFCFALMFVPSIGRIGEVLLEPGYWLPETYWGGIHDPIQLLLVAVLNLCFYTLLFWAIFATWSWSRQNMRRL